ncbi:FecR domain-containing protein [Rhodanobacter sp. DHG33]|uniref:FecR domain-containing protein n=1 Tax=Rhodanobacter sp. DHG33 TaxID=2775921 RepID=UPI0017833C2C|nr:FecR domain-containing protein [Rhodanobacter sp. DHG33]MBD8898182.1 FecR domain-containing protein [Rhodanobacter sp. DHG33]
MPSVRRISSRPRRLAAFALLSIGMLPFAHAADWTYRVRPTDNIWDVSRRYLKHDVSWQQLQTYNQVADPYHLPPGMRLRIPVAWLAVQPANATVVAEIGSAHAQQGDQGTPQDVKVGMSFGMGTRLTTDADASLTLQFADGSRVLMQHDSVLELNRLSAYGHTGMADTRLRLQRGRTVNDVTHVDGVAHFSVQTPSSISSVRGTHFRVGTDGSDHSQTEVLGGRVDVNGDGRHVLIAGGKGVAVAAGERPGTPQVLLDAPVLHCPEQPVGSTSYPLAWTALPNATHYRAQVAPNARFEALLMDRVVTAAGVNLPDLPDGSYAIRVHGIDAQQLEGQDATCTIQLSAHPQPPLVVEPQPGSKVRDTRPHFGWTESTEAASYAWQLASDANFQQLLGSQDALTGTSARAPHALPLGRYWWRIATRDRNGKLGPYSAPMPFDLVAEPPVPAANKPKHAGKNMDFSWQTGLPGQHYQVQMSRDPDLAHPTLDETLAQPQLEIPKPAHGTWYLHVRTIDTDGYAGPWSPVQKVKLPCIACRIAVAGGGAAVLWLLL